MAFPGVSLRTGRPTGRSESDHRIDEITGIWNLGHWSKIGVYFRATGAYTHLFEKSNNQFILVKCHIAGPTSKHL